ncbi:MAG: GHKL domain-containing protein [Lachnospiraceae bacterium]|nr:GHKL domain-containing protein [Lachnospiraceae bacterium]
MIERLYLIFEILAILFCLYGLYGEKFKWNIYTIALIGIEFVIFQLDYAYSLPISIEGFVYLLLLLYSIVQFKSGIKDAIINFAICIILCVFMQLICYIPVFFLYDTVQSYAGYLVNILFFLIAFLLYRKGIFTRVSEFLRSNDKIVAFIIFLMTILVAYVLISIKSNIIIGIFDYIVITLSIFLIILLVSLWQNQKLINRHLNREKQLDEMYGNALRELIVSIRQKQHDYKNQLIAIQSMLDSVNDAEALKLERKKYFDLLEDEERYVQLLSKNDEPLISGFLYTKINEAERIGIDVKPELMINKIDDIDIVGDVIKILGILIDNAVEALNSNDITEKKMEIKVEYIKKIIIRVGNVSRYIPRSDSVRFFEKGFSTKGEMRGLGLANVMDIANRYRGNVSPINEERENCNWFVIEVVLNK